jgi:hypothetical protein
MPSFPVLPESGGFLFSDPALVSQLKPFRIFIHGTAMKDQP